MKRTVHRSLFLLLAPFALGVSCFAQSGGQVPPAEALAEWPTHLKASVTGINQVPYISTYYIEPKVPVGKPAVISYYLTDHEHKEYMRDDKSQTFTVDYWVNGVKKTILNVKAGDNSLTLNGLDEGKVLFAIQSSDKEGRKSHRLYQEFLVVNPASEGIPANKIVTPDLAQFGISNDGTNPVETTKGLTEMLNWASEKGYRKVILPKGTYLLDEKATVRMATRLTLDMNGSTFKLNPNALAKALMFEFVNCFDSHVENGTFEGDLKEHDFKNAPQNSEWVNAIEMGQDTNYCTLRNVKVLDVTGYGTTTSIGGQGIRRYSLDQVRSVGKFVAGDIDTAGNLSPSDLRSTTEKAIDISAFVNSMGFFQFGPYLGYQGNPAGNWVYKASFYGADGAFLETIEGFMYRRIYPPKEARTVRFTIFSRHFLEAATQPELTVFNFRAPYNCAFLNVRHENVRCVGMVPSGFNNLLVEGCEFVNCGSSSAKCAFDAEDGWDLMQDLTFRKNVFGKNPNNEFLTCAGHNFVMEDNIMKVYMWDRTRSAVFRNNKIKSAVYVVAHRSRSGFHRIAANEYEGPVIIQTQSKFPDQDFAVRDSVIPPGSRSWMTKDMPANMGVFYNCKITGGNVTGKFTNCEISNLQGTGGQLNLTNCTVRDSLLKTSGPKTRSTITSCTITNSQIVTGGNAMVLRNNKLIDTTCNTTGDWQEGHEFTLIGNTVQTALTHLVAVGNSYARVALESNKITSTNPDFAAVKLINPVNKELKSPSISLVGNQINAAGGAMLTAVRLTDATMNMAVEVANNKLTGLAEMSDNLPKSQNVTITRK